jgi:hypothetical protein
LGDQGFEVGLGEAVEEEVSDDEVVFFSLFSVKRGEVEGVGMVDSQAGGDVEGGCFAAAAEEFEHSGAGVDGVGLEAWVLCEELSEEATVSVAEDEGSLLLEESGEVVDAAALEGSAEGEVFEPAIRAGYMVEVDFGGSCQRHSVAFAMVAEWIRNGKRMTQEGATSCIDLSKQLCGRVVGR